MKPSTWAALALCAGRALPLEAVVDDQCDVVCDAIKSEISSADEACAKARKSLPRPKIGRVCQEAFEKALELTCVEACQQHGTGRVPESRLGEACDKRRREVPRPVAHKACVDGFNAGFTATTAFIAERVELPAQEPQMDEETKAALLEQHDLILEEVAAELDYLVELDSPEEAEQTQNVDVPKLGESTEGVSAGKMESAASTAGMTLRDVDESRASIPRREGRDKLEKDSSSGKRDSTMTRIGPEFMEVLKAEHVKGFTGASRDKSIGNQVGEESVKVPGPAEEKEAAGVSSEANLVMELPQDGRFREILTVDHIKAYNNPSSGDKPRSNRGRSRPAGIVPGPAEEEAAGVSSEANLVTGLPQDGRFQEVLTVDHIKAYNNPSSSDKVRSNRGRSRPAGIVPGPAQEKETAGVGSEANLVTELPQDGRQEILTVDHIKAYNNPSSGDKPRSNRGRSRPAGIVPGPAEEKETAGVGSEANLVTDLPQDGRFQEVLTVDHVKAYNNKPRSHHGRSRPADATSGTEDVPTSGGVKLEDFVTLGQPEPPLSANEKRLEELSAKEPQLREMQEDEVATLESEGNS